MIEKENIYELPRGWTLSPLKDVCEILDHLRRPINSSERNERIKNKKKSELYPYYGATGPVGLIDDFITEGEFVLIGEDAAPFFDKSKDVAYEIKGKTWVNNHAHILKSHFNNRFLRHYLNIFDYDGYVSGTTRLKLTKGFLEKIPVKVAPLPEQNRIVEKLDELLSELEKGKEQLQVALAQLKVYRQAVLKWAFEGRLTNEGVKEGELPEGWKVVELNKVCNKIQDGSHFSPKEQYDSPGENRFKYITAKNIRNDYMDLSNVTYVDEKFHNSIFHRCNPEFGDVLLTKDGVNTGEVTLNTLHEDFSLLSSVCLFKTKREVLLSEFLKYYFQSPLGSGMITGSMTGTAIKRIILGKIKVAEILLPSMNEQHSIIEEIKARLSVCEKTGETITQALQQAETLKQSLLQQAFEGKLVPQDPDDETASVLLERIKREREHATTLTKPPRSPRSKTTLA